MDRFGVKRVVRLGNSLPTDARRVGDGLDDRSRADEWRQRGLFRRRAIQLFLVGIFMAGSLAALFGQGGYFSIRKLQSEVLSQGSELDASDQRIQSLRERIQALGDEQVSKERIAREALGLAKPGEIVFLLPPETPNASPQPAPEDR